MHVRDAELRVLSLGLTIQVDIDLEQCAICTPSSNAANPQLKPRPKFNRTRPQHRLGIDKYGC